MQQNVPENNFEDMNQLVEYIQNLDEQHVANIINSIPEENSQIIITIGKSLRHFADELLKRQLHSDTKDIILIKELSEQYRRHYPKLLELYGRWKPYREELIELLRTSADKLDRNFTYVSYIRIVASSADLARNLVRILKDQELSIAGFTIGNLSLVSLVSLLLEKILSKGMYTNLKRAIKEDMKLFEEIKRWSALSDSLNYIYNSVARFSD